MQVILFGASGMVGQGVLRECLLDPDVTQVLSVVRTPASIAHAKLTEIVHANFLDFSALEPQLAGVDACLWTLGVTSVGTTEEAYRRITLDFTAAAARTLHRVNADMAFVFVSGRSTDRSEKGPVMWARVKGAAENVVLKTFRNGYAFRPGVIQPLHGVKSRTALYNFFYVIFVPLLPLFRLIPNFITTTEEIGRRMLEVAKRGYPKRILEMEDITQRKMAEVEREKLMEDITQR